MDAFVSDAIDFHAKVNLRQRISVCRSRDHLHVRIYVDDVTQTIVQDLTIDQARAVAAALLSVAEFIEKGREVAVMTERVTLTLTREQAKAMCLIVTVMELMANRIDPYLEAAIVGAESIILQLGAGADEPEGVPA